MADRFGGIDLPLTAPSGGGTAGDPALDTLLEAFKTILNAYAPVGWQGVAPGKQVVVKTFAHNPEEMVFSETHLPALYAWRTKGSNEWMAEEYLIAKDEITMLWVYPPAPQAQRRVRDGITNGFAKLILAFLAKSRDVAWVAASDRADGDAIETAKATSTSATLIQSADLDGVVGGDEMLTPRYITATTLVATGAYNTVDQIVITGEDHSGNEISSAIQLTSTNGGDIAQTDSLFSRVASISIPAQLLTTGSISFGHTEDAASLAEGSNVALIAGLQSLDMKGWRDRMIAIKMLDGSSMTRTYECLEMTFDIEERWRQDLEINYDKLDGADVDITRSDGSLYEQLRLDS